MSATVPPTTSTPTLAQRAAQLDVEIDHASAGDWHGYSERVAPVLTRAATDVLRYALGEYLKFGSFFGAGRLVRRLIAEELARREQQARAATPDDEYTLAYRMAQHHLERLCREEAAAQWRWARDTLTTRQQKTFQLRYSATVEALLEMSKDPTLTRERVVAFLHAPEAYVYEDAERRLTVQGAR